MWRFTLAAQKRGIPGEGSVEEGTQWVDAAESRCHVTVWKNETLIALNQDYSLVMNFGGIQTTILRIDECRTVPGWNGENNIKM